MYDDPVTQPLLLGSLWLEGCSHEQLHAVEIPSYVLSGFLLQLNTADTLPLIGEMRLGG